jgi:hypothetical protein
MQDSSFAASRTASTRGQCTWLSKTQRRTLAQRFELAREHGSYSFSAFGTVWTLPYDRTSRPRGNARGTQCESRENAQEGRRGPNAKMRAYAKYREATRFLLASIIRRWRQMPAVQLKLLQPPPPPPRPSPPPQQLPSSPPPQVADQPMEQAANRPKRPVSSPQASGSSARGEPKRIAAPPTGPSSHMLLPPALPQIGPEPGRPKQPSRPSSSSLPSVNDVITHKLEEELLAKKRNEVRCTAGTIAELISANVADVWSSMMHAEGVVEAHERAQGIVREERYKLERQQVWLEKFLQSKLNEGVSIRGHLR